MTIGADIKKEKVTPSGTPACKKPINIGTAEQDKTPEQSDYTSIQERNEHPGSNCLRPFIGSEDGGIPFNLKDYLELVDWGGREVKRTKRGYIPASVPPILIRLKMDASPVLGYLSKDNFPGFGALGPVSMFRIFAN